MKVFAYSPSIEVYAAVKTAVGYDYYDLSTDVVSCVVSRKCDAASTFSIRLQNVNSKYNDVFMPFDKVVVIGTKSSGQKLMTGYITKVPNFTVYGGDITIEGMCPIYRLQQLYWDPGLRESARLLGYGGEESSWDAVLLNLLTKAGGYSESQVFIGAMPDEVISYAKELYEAGMDSSQQLKDRANEFYQMLQTHGPKITSTTSSSASQTSGGGFSLLGDGVNFDVSKEKFVKEWGPRIDAYIERVIGSRSPVYGHGNVYAEAAWIGRMDPRWLPVIGFFETGLGTASSYAGYPYNLYGWGCTDSGETSVARSQDGYDSFIHFMLDNAGNRDNGWGGAKVLNEYTDLAELDATYCSSSAGRIENLKAHMASI